MNGENSNRNDGNAPERGRVYAPTHSGASGLNLRPFRANAAGAFAAPEDEAPPQPPMPDKPEPDEPDEPELPEAPNLFAEEPEDTAPDEPYEPDEQDEPEIILAPHKETVREAKRRDRRLTEREKRRRERRRRIMRLISTAIFGVIFIAALLLLYFTLIIDNIEVYGGERIPEEDILAASGLRVGQHMWLANLSAAKEAVEADPYVASLEITRVYPDRLILRVTERTEKAVILGMNTHAVIDGEGYVLSLGTRASYEGLLAVYGTGAGGYQLNQRLGEESDFHSRTLVTLLAALEASELLDTVATLDISNPLNVTMTTFDGLTVQLGQPEDAEEKLENFRIILPALIQNGYDKSGTLILSAKDAPVYSPPSSGQTVPVDPIDPAEPTGSPEPGATLEPEETPAPDETGTPAATPPPDDPYSG